MSGEWRLGIGRVGEGRERLLTEVSAAARAASTATTMVTTVTAGATWAHLGELSTLLGGENLVQREAEVDSCLTERGFDGLGLGPQGAHGLAVALAASAELTHLVAELVHLLPELGRALVHLLSQRLSLATLGLVEVESLSEPLSAPTVALSLTATPPAPTDLTVFAFTLLAAMHATPSMVTALAPLPSHLIELSLLLRSEHTAHLRAQLAAALPDDIVERIELLRETEDGRPVGTLGAPSLT